MPLLDNIGFEHFWENLKVNILSKKQDILNGDEGQTVIFDSSGVITAVDRNTPIYTEFSSLKAGSGILSIGDKMTYAVGMRDGANFITFGQFHSYINATIRNSDTSNSNTTTFTFSLFSDGFTLTDPIKITGMTTAYITPNMLYPMEYTITGITNGIKIDCEIFAFLPEEIAINFNLHAPIIYISTEPDSITIQRILDKTISNAIKNEY